MKPGTLKTLTQRALILGLSLLAGIDAMASAAQAPAAQPPMLSQNRSSIQNQNQDQALESITRSLQRGQRTDQQQGQFVQRKYLSILPQPLISSGHYAFQADTGLQWEVLQPLHSKLTFSAAGIQQEQNGQQVWLARADQPGIAAIGQIMAAIFTRDWHTLKEFFQIDLQLPATPSTSDAANAWSLTLTPTQAPLQQAISHIQLSGDQELRHMTLFEANRDRTEIDFL